MGLEHMIPMDLMAAKVKEAVAARRNDDFVIIARTNGPRASNMDDALRRAEAYKKAGADVLLLITLDPEELRSIAQRLGGPLMYIAGRGGLAGSGMTLDDLGSMGYKIIVDVTALTAGYAAWKSVYSDLANGFGAKQKTSVDWGPPEKDMLRTIGTEKMLEIERATVEKNKS